MVYVTIITLIIVGALSASEYLKQKIAQSKTVLDYMHPYQGWIGLVSLVLGIYWLFYTLMHIGTWLRFDTVGALVALTSFTLMVVLGVLLSLDLLKKYLGSVKPVMNVCNLLVNKCSPMKEKLGLVAIITGFVYLLLRIT